MVGGLKPVQENSQPYSLEHCGDLIARILCIRTEVLMFPKNPEHRVLDTPSTSKAANLPIVGSEFHPSILPKDGDICRLTETMPQLP